MLKQHLSCIKRTKTRSKCFLYFVFIGYKVLSLLDIAASDSDPMDQADVYVHITFIKKWDICAGAALLKALGKYQQKWILFNLVY